MKYLIVKCVELGDQWECDANRNPVCLTDDYSKYGRGYEVYELLEDGTFKLIKDYEECIESGIAIVKFDEEDIPSPLEKFKNLKRYEVTKSKVKKWKHKYGFSETVEVIYHGIRGCGEHGEMIGNEFVSICEYIDDRYFAY